MKKKRRKLKAQLIARYERPIWKGNKKILFWEIKEIGKDIVDHTTEEEGQNKAESKTGIHDGIN